MEGMMTNRAVRSTWPEPTNTLETILNLCSHVQDELDRIRDLAAVEIRREQGYTVQPEETDGT